MIKRVKLAVLLMLLAVSAHAQSLTNATALYNDFVKLLSTSGESTSASGRYLRSNLGVFELPDDDNPWMYKIFIIYNFYFYRV